MTHLYLYAINDFIHNHWDIIVTVIIGAIAGYLAEWIVPGRGYGLLVTIVFGIVGGLLGDWLFRDYLNFTHDPLFDRIIRSTIGAMLLVILFNILTGNKKRKKKERDIYEWENE
jgi:uncharacterized membrane protein YeaQ/YmgE (transglycosylase-associated protein family)